KNWRLMQAKEAAQAEIEQYHLQREKELKSKEAAKEAQEKMTILQTYVPHNRDEVWDNLLAFVCDIRPEILENYHING
uniref:V-type proton ATPase subunit G n=1 Tax=Rhinopithecus bieti TaxID=61621 RepID=A0A2K6MWA1_RHIBE